MVFRHHATVESPSRSHFCSLPSAFCPSDLSPLPPTTSAHTVHDRNAPNFNPVKALRTTFFTTEGWGGSTTAHFKFHLNSTGLSSLECAVPRPRLLSLLECAVAKTRPRNSFRMSSSKKRGGGGSISCWLSLFLNGKRRTANSLHQPSRIVPLAPTPIQGGRCRIP